MKRCPGRPNLGKTATIKQRVVTVYLPTVDMLGEWKTKAASHGLSLSNLVTEIVDNAMRKSTAGLTPREELERQLKGTLLEMNRLKEQLEHAQSSLKAADTTIAEYRAKISATLPASIDQVITRKIVRLFLSNPVVQLDSIPFSIGLRLDDSRGLAKVRDSLKFLSECDLIEDDIYEGRWKAEPEHKCAARDKTRGH